MDRWGEPEVYCGLCFRDIDGDPLGYLDHEDDPTLDGDPLCELCIYQPNWNIPIGPVERMLISARKRAKDSHIPYALHPQDITIPKVCPIFGLELKRNKDNFGECSPSLDRMNSKLGYVPGNVAVISWKANRIKNDGTATEHEKIATWMKAPHVAFTGCIYPGRQRNALWETKALGRARERAKNENVPCSLEIKDIRIPRICPILDIELHPNKGQFQDDSPSIDRLEPIQGYIPENIAIISWRANRIKSNGTAEEHEKIAAWMRAHAATT